MGAGAALSYTTEAFEQRFLVENQAGCGGQSDVAVVRRATRFPSRPGAMQLGVKRDKQCAPVFGLRALEQHQLEAVTCGMVLRDRVPAAVLDRHARLVPHRFEAHVKLCRLSRRECRLTPGEREPLA